MANKLITFESTILGVMAAWMLLGNVNAQNPTENNMGAYLFVFHQDFGFCETSDFETFKPLGHFNDKGGVMKATNFVSPKHGDIIPITLEEADRLEKYWKSFNQ